MTKKLKTGASVPTMNSAAVLDALNTVAALYAVDPAAVAGMINTESEWDTRCIAGKYIGLTQVGPEIPKLLNLTREQFLDLSACDQIDAYSIWLDYYKFTKKMARHGIDVTAMSLARQAAVLQAMQFAPNGEAWKAALSKGDFSVVSTRSKQAVFLGDTSIGAMEGYYVDFFTRFPPAYCEAEAKTPSAPPKADTLR